MSNEFDPIPYTVHITADGSPTLSLFRGEKMHSMQGALSESLQIYSPTIEQALKATSSPRILSMGLGLAYNEWIALALLKKSQTQSFQLVSLEIVNFLRQGLIDSLNGHSNHPLFEVYRQVSQKVAEHFFLNHEDLLAWGQKAYREKNWLLLGALSETSPIKGGFHALLYDAFSGQSSPELWHEKHLISFLQEYADKGSAHFSTYAATGNLTRALKAEGFNVEKAPGFGFKRESTRAWRQN